MAHHDADQAYWALRRNAGLVALSAWSAIEVRGADRAAFLHRLLTNALNALSPGTGCEAGLTTASAKIIAMLLAHTQATLGAIPLRVIRYSFGLPDGFLLITPAAQAQALRQQLLDGGREHGIVPVGWDAFNIARLETGLPWEGLDFDEETLLPETGLERRAVSYTKGCYVGQEIIARMDTYGSASRRLVGVLGEGTRAPQAGDVVALEDQEIGQITSAAWSPALKRPIALAWIKRPHYERLDIAVTIRSPGGAMPAKLAQPPFV